MPDLLKQVQHQASMERFLEVIASVDNEKLIDFTTEVYRQTINRRAILRDLENGVMQGISVADALEKQVYPLRLRGLSSKELREEATRRYEEYLTGDRDSGARMKEFFGIGGEVG